MTKVMLFSSGLDSFLANNILQRQKEKYNRIYFDLDTIYSKHELDFLEKWYPTDYIKKDFRLVMGDLEKSDAFVPNRNLLLVSMAQARYNADVIYINSTLDDRVSDGSVKFRQMASKVLTLINDKDILVTSVLDNKEKTSHCIDYSLSVGFPMDLINKTFSCFTPSDECNEYTVYRAISDLDYEEVYTFKSHECLNCPACFRKYSSICPTNLYVPFNNKSLLYNYSILSPEFRDLYPDRSKSIDKYISFNKNYDD